MHSWYHQHSNHLLQSPRHPQLLGESITQSHTVTTDCVVPHEEQCTQHSMAWHASPHSVTAIARECTTEAVYWSILEYTGECSVCQLSHWPYLNLCPRCPSGKCHNGLLTDLNKTDRTHVYTACRGAQDTPPHPSTHPGPPHSSVHTSILSISPPHPPIYPSTSSTPSIPSIHPTPYRCLAQVQALQSC